MSESLLDKLDSFLGEIAKRALGWPKHHSNTAALVALDMMSARSELLIAKLRFLKRRTTKHDSIGGEAMRALSDDVNSLCLVKECRELEEVFGPSSLSFSLFCLSSCHFSFFFFVSTLFLCYYFFYHTS